MENSTSLSQIQKDKLALKSFIENFHWAATLSDAQARSNLHEGILEIVDRYDRHCSNGLLLTRNGYMITCYHCVWDLAFNTFYAKNNEGQKFQITRMIGFNKKNDTALVKLNMNGPTESIQYRFAERHDISSEFRVNLFVRWEQRLKRLSGTVQIPKLESIEVGSGSGQVLNNQITLDMRARPGDSGGLIITEQGSIYGLLTGAVEATETFYRGIKVVKKTEKKLSTCTFWFGALDIIFRIIYGPPKK